MQEDRFNVIHESRWPQRHKPNGKGNDYKVQKHLYNCLKNRTTTESSYSFAEKCVGFLTKYG